MRKTFLGVLVFMSQLIFAQGIEVISTKALTLDGQGVFLPKISPKGGLRSSNQRRHERSEKI